MKPCGVSDPLSLTESKPIHRPAPLSWVVMVILLAPAVLGLVCWYGSSLPFQLVKSHVDALAIHGSAAPVNEELFRRVRLALRVAGAAALLLGACLIRTRGRVQQGLSHLREAGALFTRDLAHALWGWGRTEDRVHLVGLGAIICVGIGARLFFLFQPMCYDEAFTFMAFASKPLYVGLTYYPAPNNHLFHTLLVHVMTALLGNQPWAIRLPAFLAGALLIPATYLAIRLLYQQEAALFTAGWVAASPVFIEYSTNARGYTLACLTFMVLLALAVYVMEHRNLFAWVLVLCSAVAGLYTMPTMIYPCGVILTWVLLSTLIGKVGSPKAQLLKDAVVTTVLVGGVTCALYSPILMTTWGGSITGVGIRPPVPTFIQGTAQSLHLAWSQWNQDLPGTIAILLVLGFMVAAVFDAHLASGGVSLLWAAALWCPLVLIATRMVLLPRVWLPFSLVYVAMAAAGVNRLLWGAGKAVGLPRGSYSRLMAVLVVILTFQVGVQVVRTQSVRMVNQSEQFPDAESIVLFLKSYLAAGDRVIAGVPANAPLEYYWMRQGAPMAFLNDDVGASRRVLIVAHPPQQEVLERLIHERGLATRGFGTPRAIRSYPSATVYELMRNKQPG